MPFAVRTSLIVACIAALAALLAGCSDYSPCGPCTTVDRLHVQGKYVRVTGDPPQGVENGARITVRWRTQTGPVVSDLEVDINDYPLEFYPSGESYMGVVPALEPGDSLRLSVSDGSSSISRTVPVPYAPTDVQLVGGVWDISGPSALNRLEWSNPGVLGLAVVIQLYGFDGEDVVFIFEVISGEPDYTDFTISNRDVPGYADFLWIYALVAQMEYVQFPVGPGLTVLSGTIGEWPTSAGR